MDNDDADPVLKHPTIADLITFLQAYPPETKIIIQDADTGYSIVNFNIAYFQREQRMEIYSCHGDME